LCAAQAGATQTTCTTPGIGILLPLAGVVCYITRQAQYTSNNILQRTLYVFFHLTEQKNSLTIRRARVSIQLRALQLQHSAAHGA
jgi:hypothetical protein